MDVSSKRRLSDIFIFFLYFAASTHHLCFGKLTSADDFLLLSCFRYSPFLPENDVLSVKRNRFTLINPSFFQTREADAHEKDRSKAFDFVPIPDPLKSDEVKRPLYKDTGTQRKAAFDKSRDQTS